MKKAIISLVLAIFIFPAFSQVDKIAKEVLNAYKDRNAENLKKHASGIFKYAISDSYFTEDNIQSDLKVIDNWNGQLIEIRYSQGDLMGKTVQLATAYYADNPENSNEICVVILSSTDKENWLMFAGGIGTETKDEFNKMSLSLSETQKADSKPSNKKCNIEMANGEKLSGVGKDQIVKCIDKIDEDNFYLILSSGDDYIQTSHSEQGFIVQYSEGEEQFEAEAYLKKEQVVDIFIKYYQNKDWKQGNNWIEPSY